MSTPDFTWMLLEKKVPKMFSKIKPPYTWEMFVGIILGTIGREKAKPPIVVVQ